MSYLIKSLDVLTIKHAPNRQGPKCRDQNTMRHGPIFLPRVMGREQTIMNTISELIQRTGNHFGETLLVKDLIHELMSTDEYSRSPEESQPIYRTWSWISYQHVALAYRRAINRSIYHNYQQTVLCCSTALLAQYHRCCP